MKDPMHSRGWGFGLFSLGILSTLATWCLLVLALFFFVFPLLWMIMNSFKPTAQVLALPPVWIFRPTLENYQAIFSAQLSQGHVFSTFLVNSLIVTSSTTALCICSGGLAAYALARLRFAGRERILFWILSNRMFPPAAIVLPIYLMMSQLSWLDTYQALILPYAAMNLPLAVWLLVSFFSDIPMEIEEAAMVEGASRLQALLRILLPLAAPGIAVAAMFCWIFTWNEFLIALIITRFNTQTGPIGLAEFVGAYQVEWGQMAAAGTVMVAPVLIMLFILRRHLVGGLTFGAVKG